MVCLLICWVGRGCWRPLGTEVAIQRIRAKKMGRVSDVEEAGEEEEVDGSWAEEEDGE